MVLFSQLLYLGGREAREQRRIIRITKPSTGVRKRVLAHACLASNQGAELKGSSLRHSGRWTRHVHLPVESEFDKDASRPRGCRTTMPRCSMR